MQTIYDTKSAAADCVSPDSRVLYTYFLFVRTATMKKEYQYITAEIVLPIEKNAIIK